MAKRPGSTRFQGSSELLSRNIVTLKSSTCKLNLKGNKFCSFCCKSSLFLFFSRPPHFLLYDSMQPQSCKFMKSCSHLAKLKVKACLKKCFVEDGPKKKRVAAIELRRRAVLSGCCRELSSLQHPK